MARVVFAVDSFKGTVRAAEAGAQIAAGWAEAAAALVPVQRPMADGGEGTLDAFLAAHPTASVRPVAAPAADGVERDTAWAMLPDGTAVVELARVCGIEGLGRRRLPLDAHSTGLGVVIAAALDAGAARIVVGIGSSASTDGGAGMLAGLGARLLDTRGDLVVPGARGLAEVAAVDVSRLRALPPGGVQVLSDVTNPLLGTRGAAAVFGPQKGLVGDDIAKADAALGHWAAVLAGAMPTADTTAPGAGAAGGVGFALQAWGARSVPGASAVAALIGLEAAIAGSDAVVTGEGSYDAQSADGKVPALVAALAARHGVPAFLVAGQLASEAGTTPFAATVSLSELASSIEDAVADPCRWLREAGRRLAGTA